MEEKLRSRSSKKSIIHTLWPKQWTSCCFGPIFRKVVVPVPCCSCWLVLAMAVLLVLSCWWCDVASAMARNTTCCYLLNQTLKQYLQKSCNYCTNVINSSGGVACDWPDENIFHQVAKISVTWAKLWQETHPNCLFGCFWLSQVHQVLYTPPPIPVGFQLFWPEFPESLEFSGFFLKKICSSPYVEQFQTEYWWNLWPESPESCWINNSLN